MPEAMASVADVLGLTERERTLTYAEYPFGGSSTQSVWKSRVDQAKKELQEAGLVLRRGDEGYQHNRWTLSPEGEAAAEDAAREDPATARHVRGVAVGARGGVQSDAAVAASDEAASDAELGPAVRTGLETVRFVRDSAKARQAKQRAGYECLLCGTAGIPLPGGGLYAEAHHVRPLRDGGPDHESNLVCVCPTCHAALDYRAVRISDDAVARSPSPLSREYVAFHNGRVGLEM